MTSSRLDKFETLVTLSQRSSADVPPFTLQADPFFFIITRKPMDRPVNPSILARRRALRAFNITAVVCEL